MRRFVARCFRGVSRDAASMGAVLGRNVLGRRARPPRPVLNGFDVESCRFSGRGFCGSTADGVGSAVSIAAVSIAASWRLCGLGLRRAQECEELIRHEFRSAGRQRVLRTICICSELILHERHIERGGGCAVSPSRWPQSRLRAAGSVIARPRFARPERCSPVSRPARAGDDLLRGRAAAGCLEFVDTTAGSVRRFLGRRDVRRRDPRVASVRYTKCPALRLSRAVGLHGDETCSDKRRSSRFPSPHSGVGPLAGQRHRGGQLLDHRLQHGDGGRRGRGRLGRFSPASCARPSCDTTPVTVGTRSGSACGAVRLSALPPPVARSSRIASRNACSSAARGSSAAERFGLFSGHGGRRLPGNDSRGVRRAAPPCSPTTDRHHACRSGPSDRPAVALAGRCRSAAPS